MTPEEKIEALTGVKLGEKKKKQTSGEFMQSITGMYQLSPEAEERFSKSFILNTKGTVRVSVLSLGPPFLLFVILGTVLYMLSMKLSGLTNSGRNSHGVSHLTGARDLCSITRCLAGIIPTMYMS